MLCASVWLRTATGLKSERADPGVTAHLSAELRAKLSPNVRVYTMENIATINIYPPRIQDKHRRAEELEKTGKSAVAYASAINVYAGDINIYFRLPADGEQKCINIVCHCCTELCAH